MKNTERFIMNVYNKISTKLNLNEDNLTALMDILYSELKNYSMKYKEHIAGNFNAVLEDYISNLRIQNIKESTIENRVYTLQEINSYLNKDIQDITIFDLRDYLTHKKEVNISSTINNHIRVIKAFFTWLYEEEYITTNPSRKLRKVKEPTTITKAIEPLEVEEIKENCKNDRDRAIIELFLATGLRVSELIQINVSDIDFSNNHITVRGKGDKERTVIFTDKCKYYILKHLNSRKDFESDILFASLRSPFQRLKPRAVQKVIHNIKQATHIEHKLSPHCFRHTMATNMLQSGADVTVVQKLLGHNNINTTLIYAAVSMNIIDNQYKKCNL